jgi:predicted NAD/FAD-binding protein
MTIAVVGTGIAGLSAAYALSRSHDVALFEAADEPGGHTRTVRHDGLALDTGFIVHNVPNYPFLARLLDELGVRTQPSEMSFSVECGCGVAWSSRRPWRAGRRLLGEILRFLRTAGKAETAGKTLDRFTRDEGYSESFRRHYLVPMTAAIWSAAPARALDLPASFGIDFFANHGMLGLRRHRWRTVVGGSTTYVRAILERVGGTLHAGTPVRSIERENGAIVLTAGDGPPRRFEGVVVATHAPDALRLLADPSGEERRLLGAFRTTRNAAVLHTDSRFLPRRPGDRAAWNYEARRCEASSPLPTVTYSLNRLQRLPGTRQYCVTLNRGEEIDPASVLAVFDDAHPLPTPESAAAQSELHRLNGPRRTAFAGAWQGYGFHEDGVVSGLRAAAALGGRRP